MSHPYRSTPPCPGCAELSSRLEREALGRLTAEDRLAEERGRARRDHSTLERLREEARYDAALARRDVRSLKGILVLGGAAALLHLALAIFDHLRPG